MLRGYTPEVERQSLANPSGSVGLSVVSVDAFGRRRVPGKNAFRPFSPLLKGRHNEHDITSPARRHP